MFLKIYELDYVKFLSAPGLALQADLEKTKVISDILTDIYMLLMVEKGVRGGICHSTYWYAKANNKYMEDCDKNKESSYIHIDMSLCEMYPNTEFFLVRIFPYSVQMQENMDQKKLRIWAHFT